MIQDVYNKWNNGTLQGDDLTGDFADLPDFLEELYSDLKIKLEKDIDPFSAYLKTLKINNFASLILSKRPDLILLLSDWIKRLKSDLEEISKKIGAVYFDISVGIPFGISVSLTFQPKS